MSIFVYAIRFYRIPKKNSPHRQPWIDAIGRVQTFSEVDNNTLNFSICSFHFDAADIKTGIDKKTRLVPGAIPVFLPEDYHSHQQSMRMNEISESISETPPLEPLATHVCERSWYLLAFFSFF